MAVSRPRWDESRHPRDDRGRFARQGGKRWAGRVLASFDRQGKLTSTGPQGAFHEGYGTNTGGLIDLGATRRADAAHQVGQLAQQMQDTPGTGVDAKIARRAGGQLDSVAQALRSGDTTPQLAAGRVAAIRSSIADPGLSERLSDLDNSLRGGRPAAPGPVNTNPRAESPRLAPLSQPERDVFVQSISDRIGAQHGETPPVRPTPTKPVSHPKLWHASTSVEGIQATGFRVGEGQAGAFFGKGIYLHTTESEHQQYLAGVRMFQDENIQGMQAHASVTNPFVVPATAADEDPGAVMHRALVKAGIARSGERLRPAEITRRLQDRGYDAVEVKQRGFNQEIAGSQLVVFDAADVKPGVAPVATPGGAADLGKVARISEASTQLQSMREATGNTLEGHLLGTASQTVAKIAADLRDGEIDEATAAQRMRAAASSLSGPRAQKLLDRLAADVARPAGETPATPVGTPKTPSPANGAKISAVIQAASSADPGATGFYSKAAALTAEDWAQMPEADRKKAERLLAIQLTLQFTPKSSRTNATVAMARLQEAKTTRAPTPLAQGTPTGGGRLTRKTASPGMQVRVALADGSTAEGFLAAWGPAQMRIQTPGGKQRVVSTATVRSVSEVRTAG